MKFPRFRSRERDIRSDVERLDVVRSVIRRTVAEAEKELFGLTRRLDEERRRAAFLYDDLDGDDTTTPNAEIVNEAERFLVRGDRRRLELEEHLAFLRKLDGHAVDEIARLGPYSGP